MLNLRIELKRALNPIDRFHDGRRLRAAERDRYGLRVVSRNLIGRLACCDRECRDQYGANP